MDSLGGALALLAVLAAPQPRGAAKPPPLRFEPDPGSHPTADLPPRIVFDGETVVGTFIGNVEWRHEVKGQTVRLLADRMIVHAKVPSKAETKQGGQGGDAKEGEGGGPLDFRSWKEVTIYAERVRIEIPSKKTLIEADGLYYDHATGRGVARGVRLRTTYGSARGFQTIMDTKNWERGLEAGPPPKDPIEARKAQTPLNIRAAVLRFQDFEVFDGESVDASDCDFAVPHVALNSATLAVHPVEEGGAPRGERPTAFARTRPPEQDAADRAFIIDPEDAWVQVEGLSLVPSPVSYWDTRWEASLPIRSLEYGHTSAFGFFGAIDWNLNYFLSLVPLSRLVPVELEGRSKLGFETEFFEERGFGFGPNAEYGTRPHRWGTWRELLDDWKYYGEAQYWRIHDYGDEDRTTGLPVPEADRFWGHIWHRQSVPHLGLVDVEYSALSDSAVLGEYFEKVAKEEKEQESLVYWRRNILDDLAVTGLYKWRTNDFQTQVERLPEGKLFLQEQPIFESGLYTDLTLQAAQLRLREADPLGIPPREFDREDVLSEWAYPIHWLAPYLDARPFMLLRYTNYGEVLDPTLGSEDRAAFGGGISVSQEWSRIYRFAPESFASWLFNSTSMRHEIVPKVTYTNVFSNDLDPEDTIPIDNVDTVDLQEAVFLSLRNAVFVRKPLEGKPGTFVRPLVPGRDAYLEKQIYETRRVLDSEVSFVLFPHPGRDNGGDRSSLMVLDNTLEMVRDLQLRGWLELNPNHDFRAERIDAALTYQVIPDKLTATVGDRLTRDHANVGYFFFNWTLTDKWNVDFYYSRDFERQRDVEYSVRVNRIFHRTVLSLEYVEDVGEDRNQTVYFQLEPIELLRPSHRSYQR